MVAGPVPFRDEGEVTDIQLMLLTTVQEQASPVASDTVTAPPFAGMA
jgi:hypothetical protein